MSLKQRVSRVLNERFSRLSRRPREGGPEGNRRPPLEPLKAVAIELLKLVREMVLIPTQLWLAIAEVAGAAVLWAWRRVVRPLLSLAIAAVVLVYRLALRHVTPARGVAVVAAVSIGVLIASQWVDYRAISVGNDAYAGSVGLVAPAPEIGQEHAGEAHGWVMVPIGVAALVVLGLALTGRPRLARLLIPLGIAVIAIALIVDVSNGLDEGTAAISYEGAVAHLREGFWLQLAAAAGMIACGLLLPSYLRPDRAAARTRSSRQRSRRTRKRPSMPIREART
jgi:hypothetical protein